MSPELVEQTPEPVEAPLPTPEESSVSSHEASFGPTPRQAPVEPVETPIETPQVERRHRASSQKATADDVQQINALTKELRTKEAELAKVRPDAVAGSPRLLALKRQIKALEVELTEHQPKPSTPVPAARHPEPPKQPEAPKAAAPSGFTEKEPTLDQFQDAEDPYTAWVRAVNAYDWRKMDYERQEKATQEAAARQTTEQQQAVLGRWQTRMQAYQKERPDFLEKLQATAKEQDDVPPLVYQAFVDHDKGPAMLYALLTDPAFRDETYLIADGKPVTDANVAIVQRRLLQRVQAAATGSAAPLRPVTPGPRPPNPVRTGPLHTGDEPPGDGAGLAAHEKFYGPRRTR